MGLLLSEVLAPLSAQTLLSAEDTHASLFYRFQVASDALNKAVQALQEWSYPGKEQIDSLYDIVKQDNTWESHKHALLYQIAQLTQLSIMSKLLSP